MCDCITRIIKDAKERLDPDAYMEVSHPIELDTLTPLPVRVLGPVLYYRRKRKDGTFHRNYTAHTVQTSFCPFCGVRYKVQEKEREG